MKRIFTILFLATIASSSVSAQVATFNFFGASSPATLAGTSDANATLSLLSRGAGAPASTASNSFRTTGFQNNGIALTNTDYFQFSIQANTGNTLALTGITATFAGTATFAAASGVTNQFAYSIDGAAFQFTGPAVITIGTPQTATFTFDAATALALSNVPATSIVTFRYFASGQTTTGGWGFFSVSASTQNLTLDGTVNPTVLPLYVSDLNATKQNKSTNLGWILGCTSNEVTYSVERSANGVSFGAIETKTVARERCDFPFEFTDNNPVAGTNYYRIKSSNIDGELKYSHIAKVKFEGSNSIKVFPTVTSAGSTIYYETTEAGKIVFNVMDMNGRVVKSIISNVIAGGNNINLTISELPSGKYLIQGLLNNNSRTTAVSVIKQ